VGICAILVINMKLTGIVYVSLLLGVAAGYLWTVNRIWRAARVWLVAVGAMIVGLALGFNPYGSNVLSKGDIFYPASNVADYAQTNLAGNLSQLWSPARMVLSLAAMPDRGRDATLTLKIPFSINPGELEAFSGPGPLVGGFGPWFSAGALLAMSVILTLGIRSMFGVKRIKQLSKSSTLQKELRDKIRLQVTDWLWLVTAGVAMLTILISGAINPLASVARYVPQIWWVPLIAIWLGLARGSRVDKAVSWVAVGVLMVNNFWVARANTQYSWRTSRAIDRQVKSLAARRSVVMLVPGEFYSSTQGRLAANKVAYQLTVSELCWRQVNLFSESISKECLK